MNKSDGIRDSGSEEALLPHVKVVDPHYHLLPGGPNGVVDHTYDTEQFVSDLESGHDVVATVYIECGSGYLDEGPESLRPVGETEQFVALAESVPQMTAIVPFAELSLGKKVGEVLDAHIRAGGEYVRGIRRPYNWDSSPAVRNSSRDPGRPDTLTDVAVLDALGEIESRGLVFETTIHHPQLPHLRAAAATHPDLTVVIDHLGGPLATGPYAMDRKATMAQWQRGVERIAELPNVHMKIGGIGFPPYTERRVLESPRTSEWLAEYWRADVEFVVEVFGADRCMFESNFPVDSALCDYVTLWNVFKRLRSSFTDQQNTDLFCNTAGRVYGLESYM